MILFAISWNIFHMITSFHRLQIQELVIMLGFIGFSSISSYLELTTERNTFILEKQVRIENQRVDILDNLLDKLIISSLPREIYDRMRVSEETICDWMPNCCIMFVKVWGFAEEIIGEDDPRKCLSILEQLFNQYDERTLQSSHAHKIKSTGEYYLVRGDSTLDILLEALQFLQIAEESLPLSYHVTIGVTTGPVVMAVLGSTRLNYDCFSSTVNLASRLCTSAEPSTIQITEDTVNFLNERNQDLSLRFIARPEKVNLKGIKIAQTYYVESADFIFNIPPMNTKNESTSEDAYANPH